MCDYKEIFEGVGKLKDYQVKLHVNADVPQVTATSQAHPISSSRQG